MNILVTGGSGFLGKTLIKRLLEKGDTIRVLARNEGELIKLKQLYPQIEIYTGDVSDIFEVRQAMKNIEGVYHLAANKHVGLSEIFVRECIKANTIGSLNILEESLINKTKFVIGISTDKAAQVAGVYGASKLLMERLFKQYSDLNPECKYRIVRYGNVLYSTGSVLCKWKDLIEQGKEIIVTEPEATRFFWTSEQAVDLIFDCLENAKDASPFVPDMKSIKIGDLLEAMIQKYSGGQKINIRIIGLQTGENLHEKIIETKPSSKDCEHYSITEILSLI